MSFLCWSQDTLTAQKERLLIEMGDSFVVVPYMRAKILFEQFAKLSEYKRTADMLLATKDSLIASGKQKEQELKQAIELCEQIADEKDIQIESWNQTVKNTRKKWIKITIYSSGSTALAGLLTGLIIKK